LEDLRKREQAFEEYVARTRAEFKAERARLLTDKADADRLKSCMQAFLRDAGALMSGGEPETGAAESEAVSTAKTSGNSAESEAVSTAKTSSDSTESEAVHAAETSSVPSDTKEDGEVDDSESDSEEELLKPRDQSEVKAEGEETPKLSRRPVPTGPSVQVCK
jgi:hypothetical protein